MGILDSITSLFLSQAPAIHNQQHYFFVIHAPKLTFLHVLKKAYYLFTPLL